MGSMQEIFRISETLFNKVHQLILVNVLTMSNTFVTVFIMSVDKNKSVHCLFMLFHSEIKYAINFQIQPLI